MTVEQLLKVPALRTRLLAGATGVGIEIMWAHSCELQRPWEWVGRGDLLMTTGHNVPPGSTEQVDFVRSLAAAGVCGLVLAEGMDSPPVTPDTAAVADELAFPILETAYEVPFVALSRVVAAASQGETQARLNRVLRVYDAYRTAVQTDVAREHLLQLISVEVGHALHIVDVAAGRVVLDAGQALSDEAVAAIKGHTQGTATMPGITRLKVRDEEYVLLPIGTHPGWLMVADVSGMNFDVLVLQHVNTIVTIEAERLRAETQTRLTVSGRLMGQLLEGNVDSELVRDRLAEFGLDRGPWQIITASSDPPPSILETLVTIEAAGVAHVLSSRQGVLVLMIEASEANISLVDAALGVDARIGVSNEFTRIRAVADAIRQADWAREASRLDGRRVGVYGQDRPLFLPATLAEADNVVRTVLGPLIDYDERHGTDLVDSLTVFFEANRSWQVASKTLQIHKQTLVYRMRRVSEVTGRRLDDLDDIAELHLALRTKQMLGRR